MRSLKLSEDRYIIPFNNKYFVVNEYTKQIFSELEGCEGVEVFAKKENISIEEGLNILNELDSKIDSCEYYETNVSLPVPLKIQWKMTMKCNLKCKHCYLGEMPNTCLPDDKLMEIAKKINDFGVMEVTLTGGEIFTVNCIDEIIQYFHDNEIKMVLFTNAILTKEHREFLASLKNKNLIKFIVSVDGTKDAHEAIRGKGTYDVTLQNLKMLTQLGYKVSVNMVLQKSNYATLFELVEDLNKVGVVNLQLSELIPMGTATKDMCMSVEDFKALQSIFRKINEVYKTSNIYYYADDNNSESEIYLLNEDKILNFGQEKWKCGAGLGKGTITYKGDVVCCPFMEHYKLGNVLKDSLTNIWDSETRYKFLKMIAQDNNGHRKCIVLRQHN